MTTGKINPNRPIEDEEFNKLFDMAEEAANNNCDGASMSVMDYKLMFSRELFNTQSTMFYSKFLREIESDGKTLYISFRQNKKNPLLLWRIVDFGYTGVLGRSGWEYKVWMEYDSKGNKKKVNYKGFPIPEETPPQQVEELSPAESEPTPKTA